MNEIVPTSVLAKQGVSAIAGVAGGVGLLVLGGLPSIFGIVAGVVVGLIGLGALTSPDTADKRAGVIVAAAGGLTVLAKIGLFAGLANMFLGIATVGMLGMGIWNGVKFIMGLKSRA